MIAVVCFHHDWVVIPGFTAVFSRFGLWGVDIFLFLSGFGCVYALNKYKTSFFFLKRIARLLPTCFLVGIIVCCADLYFHTERTMTYLPIRLLSFNRWYIQAILVYYLLCPLAFLILKKYDVKGLLIMVVIAFIVEMLLPIGGVWKINWAFGRMPVFLIGMYIAMFDLKLTPWQYVVSCICLAVAIVNRCVGNFVFLWTYFLAIAMPFICESLCRLKAGLTYIVEPAFRVLCVRLRLYHIIELFGIYSLEIYLIHEYLYWTLYEQPMPLWSKYILFIVIVATMCLVLKKSTNYLVCKFVSCH